MRPRPNLENLLIALAPIARATIRKAFTSDCCVATCRIMRHVFARFGYRAEAVPLAVHIYNAKMIELLDSGIRFPDNAQERRALFDKTGAWGIGICPPQEFGREKNPNYFGGHLALRIGSMLIDASLQQAERPAKNILIPPLIYVEISEIFFTAREKGQTCEVELGDCRLIYRRITNDSFRYSPDWTRSGSPYREVLHEIIEKAEEQLTSCHLLTNQ
jgi:hypothetical protein